MQIHAIQTSTVVDTHGHTPGHSAPQGPQGPLEYLSLGEPRRRRVAT